MNHNILQNPTVRYAVAVSTAAALAVSIEAGPSDEASELAYKMQPAVEQIIDTPPYEDSDTSDTELCVRPGDYDVIKEYEAAERCQKSYKNRRFALVDFTALSEYTMKEIADDTEIGLHWATAGIVKSTVTVVEPPKAVARKLKEQRVGCIDYNDPAMYASTFAKEHVPELRKYDHVMAITDIPACPPKDGGTVFGVANSAPGRVADVFDATNMYKRSGVMQVKKVAIHEGGHLLGLDHYSTVRCQSSEGKKSYNNGQMAPLDVPAYLEKCEYFEYATTPSNVMGNSTGEIGAVQADPIQRHDLLWPEKVLRGEIAVPGKEVDTTGLIFSIKGVEKSNQYGVIDLSQEAVIYDDKQKPHTFNQVSLVPQIYYTEKNVPFINHVRLYLSDENGRHVDIGPILQSSPRMPMQRFLSFGNQVIELELKRDQVMIRQTTSK